MALTDDPLQAVQEALARGDLFGAYDAAARAIEDGHDNEEMRHSQALALARMGDTERALHLFRAYGLDKSRQDHRRALGARLLKDAALATGRAGDFRAAYEPIG
jgi:thioredoxin-like negative regulator of GroEL